MIDKLRTGGRSASRCAGIAADLRERREKESEVFQTRSADIITSHADELPEEKRKKKKRKEEDWGKKISRQLLVSAFEVAFAFTFEFECDVTGQVRGGRVRFGGHVNEICQLCGDVWGCERW